MISKCPECGGEIQASVPLYLNNIVLDDNGTDLISYDYDGGENLEDGLNWDCLSIYCENNHEIVRSEA